MISLIVAVAENNAIGKDNDLLCHIPGDLKRFKEITTGHKVIMGRKTFDSLPKGPLPNRENVVISRDKHLKIDGCTMVNSVEEAQALLAENEEAFVIGGGEIYKLLLPVADKLYLTKVYKKFEADTFFPEVNESDWDVESKDFHEKGDKNDFEFEYINLIRKK